MRRLPILAALLTLSALACSPGGDSPFRGNDDTEVFDDTDSDTEADPDPGYEGPSFWRIDGSLRIEAGQLVSDGTVLEVVFTDAEGDTWTASEDGVSTCVLQAVQVADGPADALDGEPLLGWWQIDTVDQSDETLLCPWPLPTPETAFDTEHTPLVLGLGPFDSRLSPALQSAGFERGLDLYSLYMLHPAPQGDAIYVFGVAGTEAQYAGEETTVDAVPLPDGTYDLTTLVLLPVPESIR